MTGSFRCTTGKVAVALSAFVSASCRCHTHGGKIPNGGALMGQATEKGMLTKQSTPVDGSPLRGNGSQNWMTMMGLKASRQAIFASWIT